MTVDEKIDDNSKEWLWHSSFTYLHNYQLGRDGGIILYECVCIFICFNLCSLNIVHASREGSGKSQPSIR